jgi:hypothetical protein
MYVWAYSAPEKATVIALQSLHDLGMPKDINFNPTNDEISIMFDEMHTLLLKHLPELESSPPKMCTDQKIAMMMEILSVAK